MRETRVRSVWRRSFKDRDNPFRALWKPVTAHSGTSIALPLATTKGHYMLANVAKLNAELGEVSTLLQPASIISRYQALTGSREIPYGLTISKMFEAVFTAATDSADDTMARLISE